MDSFKNTSFPKLKSILAKQNITNSGATMWRTKMAAYGEIR